MAKIEEKCSLDVSSYQDLPAGDCNAKDDYVFVNDSDAGSGSGSGSDDLVGNEELAIVNGSAHDQLNFSHDKLELGGAAQINGHTVRNQGAELVKQNVEVIPKADLVFQDDQLVTSDNGGSDVDVNVKHLHVVEVNPKADLVFQDAQLVGAENGGSDVDVNVKHLHVVEAHHNKPADGESRNDEGDICNSFVDEATSLVLDDDHDDDDKVRIPLGTDKSSDTLSHKDEDVLNGISATPLVSDADSEHQHLVESQRDEGQGDNLNSPPVVEDNSLQPLVDEITDPELEPLDNTSEDLKPSEGEIGCQTLEDGVVETQPLYGEVKASHLSLGFERYQPDAESKEPSEDDSVTENQSSDCKQPELGCAEVDTQVAPNDGGAEVEEKGEPDASLVPIKQECDSMDSDLLRLSTEMKEEQRSRILEYSSHFPPPKGVKLSYGTAGFREDASLLESTMYRVGILAALRSLKTQSVIGLMITASHNKVSDNGINIADPSGGMLSQHLEPFADALANASEPLQLLALIEEFVRKESISFDGGAPAEVLLGRDTRPSGESLLEAANKGISTIIGAIACDMGFLTTPQLHWMVRARNLNTKSTEHHYFQQLSNSYRSLVDLIPDGGKTNKPNDKLVVDGANGVGGDKLEILRQCCGLVIEVRNTSRGHGVLNEGVGADFVQKEKVVPSGFGAGDIGLRCASLDGDAGRLVYFVVLPDGNKIDLVDGDKILSLFALFIKEQLSIIKGDEHERTNPCLGVVQTAYANGASTAFLKSLGLDVVLTPTGVKYLHEKALEYDIGVYFEANGHGTILFSDSIVSWLEAKNKDLSSTVKDSEKQKAVLRLLAVSKLINQAVGDALSGLLLVEAILLYNGWSIYKWNELYQDLPSRQLKLKVVDRTSVVTGNAENVILQPAGIQEAVNVETAKFGQGRCFIRPSGTEDVVRFNLEIGNGSPHNHVHDNDLETTSVNGEIDVASNSSSVSSDSVKPKISFGSFVCEAPFSVNNVSIRPEISNRSSKLTNGLSHVTGENSESKIKHSNGVAILNVEANGADFIGLNDDKTCHEVSSVENDNADEVSSLPLAQHGPSAIMGQNIELGRRSFYYLIRVPRYEDEKFKELIRLSELQVDKKTQIRDTVRHEYQNRKGAIIQLKSDLEATKSEERAARELVRAKRREIDSSLSLVNLAKNAVTVEDVQAQILSMEHKIQHETLQLKEEKQLVREIKQMMNLKDQLSANASKQEELKQALEQRVQVEERLKVLRKESVSLKDNLSKAEERVKVVKKKYDEESASLNELFLQYKSADTVRQDAYTHLLDLRKQWSEKNKHFWSYKNDARAANDFVVAGDKDSLHRHCVNQVEKFIETWNKNDEFRKEYIKCNTRSTLRRLRTHDGRALGHDEEPPSLGNVYDGRVTVSTRINLVPVVSTTERNKLIVAKNVEDNFLKNLTEEKNKTVVAKKMSTEPTSKNSLAEASSTIEIQEKKEECNLTKEEEELARKAEQLIKEEEAVRLRERREEEKAKAQEALERKRRMAEKAQARAEFRAQKEAELKEKERERRAKKKEKKKGLTSKTFESDPVIPLESLSETTRETEAVEKAVSVGKKAQRASLYAKQMKSTKSIPPPLRNRGKRRMQQWMWALATAVAVLALFFLGNIKFLRNVGLLGFGPAYN